MENEKFERAGWSLFVELDPYEVAARDLEHMPLGERAELERYVLRHFGGLPEELPDIMRTHDDGRIEISSELDFLGNVIQWLTFYTIPREIKLVRNGERAS